MEQRWREGEHNAFRLRQELTAQGYRGGVDAVQRFVREWRQTPIGQSLCPVPTRGVSPRQAAKLLLHADAAGQEWKRVYVVKLCEASPQVRVLQRLGLSFQEMVKEKRADLFDDWLKRVQRSGLSDLQKWADGLVSDEAAVRNALSTEWSNGQVEGQVNRLKTIKRQMYGRAKFDLLRAHVLYRA
ncbi:MAG: transposase [Acidobacteriota bacterium]|nr:transposase [Acidobacteriota bacterium]